MPALEPLHSFFKKTTTESVDYDKTHAAHLQAPRADDLDKRRQAELAEAAYMAKLLKISCAPEAAQKLKEMMDLETAAEKAEQLQRTAKINAEFDMASTTSQTYGGKAFQLFHGSSTAIRANQPAGAWHPVARSRLTTGYVQSYLYLEPSHVQAFWTYHLVHS